MSRQRRRQGPHCPGQNGDRIRISAKDGTLTLNVSPEELATRQANWHLSPRYDRGYAKMYVDHVMQADEGADLDFLVGKDTRLVTRESH